MPVAGNLAFVSQSGAICTAILDLALQEKIGFSHFVSIGSMLDVDLGDMIDYLGNDPSARSILLYIENLTNLRKFMSAARAVSRIKPIIVLKSGRSPAGCQGRCLTHGCHGRSGCGVCGGLQACRYCTRGYHRRAFRTAPN